MMLKSQKFGVEIEMTGLTRKAVASVVAETFGTIVLGPDNTVYRTRKIKDTEGRTWKVMRDSSISPESTNDEFSNDEHRVELVTPPLKYKDIELLQTVVQKLKSAGAVTNKSCGVHVHVDGANHNPQSLRRLINFMVARQDLIYEALEIGNRADHWCQKVSARLLNDMRQRKDLSWGQLETIWYSPSNDDYSGGIDHDHYNETRYHGINLHSLFSKKTVEFRLFNSTLNDEKIKAYVQFCLAVSAWAIESDEHIVFRSMAGYTAKEKVTIMRNILTQRLGLYGNEFKACRLHIMTPLKNKAAAEQQTAA